MKETTVGTATFEPELLPSIPPFIDGPVLRETLTAMTLGAASSKVPQAVVESVKGQVTDVVAALLGAYESKVAKGEVGPKGTSTASKTKPFHEHCATGLLYGRVQSGKTNAMIVLTAMALDNGFRVVVVLTSDNVSLVRQTANRFQVLQGVTVKDSTAIGSWLENPEHFKQSLREGGLVLVTAKNSSHMDTFVDFLSEIGAGDFPALILDDEADQATLDTTVGPNSAKPRKGAKKPLLPASKIFAHHLSLRDVLRHHVYLQVTATPYALWLQNLNHPLRPQFTKLLEPGDGYTGGAFFFPKATVDKELPPLVYVGKNEDAELVDQKDEIPQGLEEAIGYFLVAVAAQSLADPTAGYQQQNFLCHTSFKKSEHSIAAAKIRAYVAKLRDAIKADTPSAHVALERGLRELARSGISTPSVEDVRKSLEWKLRNFDVFIINSESDDLQLPPNVNFVVGGNILGRGMTIDNLLVTYYLRSTKIAQMDTVLQHARMFGYRIKAAPYLRVFMPYTQAVRFLKIQQAEDALREFQAENPSGRIIPVRASKDMRPTRTNVLDANRVVAYQPGEHLYPTLPYYRGPNASQRHEQALAWLKERFSFDEADRRTPVPLDKVIAALDVLPYDDAEPGSWDPAGIRSVLEASAELFDRQAYFYTRTASRGSLSEGMLSSDELKKLRGLGRPVLCVFVDNSQKLHTGTRRDRGESLGLPLYVFPEIVLPKGENIPVHIFNTDS